MNIHFTNKELFEALKRASLAKIKVGSHMYGTNTEKSDIDFLYIYATSENEISSFLNTHHQLQYKEDGIDHNFVSLHTFLRNTLSGDSTINFEVITSGSLKSTLLGEIDAMKDDFITYSVIRSYLGLARRDIKFYKKSNDESYKKKRIGHIIRGVMYAESMIDHTFDFEIVNKEFKDIELDVTTDHLLAMSEVKVIKLRNKLNQLLNERKLGLAKVMDVDSLKKLDSITRDIMNHNEFKEKRNNLKDFDMSMYLNAFENWVEYN